MATVVRDKRFMAPPSRSTCCSPASSSTATPPGSDTLWAASALIGTLTAAGYGLLLRSLRDTEPRETQPATAAGPPAETDTTPAA
ncbi:hypothetical protein [Streptomyces reniochalinae]|uniref:Uncharacterized protein n=1 Tax=Streptomyces reniochalinae TaxID=2250578 RepID=A0A367EL42_9ACTN|nr:hypothetical protein [Streptomyces reniochalinae]RCG18107.1 hypothetical protein DQ392_15725 [Streptomyces reniochalinae]